MQVGGRAADVIGAHHWQDIFQAGVSKTAIGSHEELSHFTSMDKKGSDMESGERGGGGGGGEAVCYE